jgi:hypothetical protein
MCNYPGDGFKHMTTDEWKRKKMSDVPQSTTHAATDTHGAHRTRSTWGGNWKTVSVYLTTPNASIPGFGHTICYGRLWLLRLAKQISQLLRKIQFANVLRWFSPRGHICNSVARRGAA